MNSRESQGMLIGLIGVLIFSLTLPMTRIVVAEVNPLLNGLGRALVAAVFAGALLWWRREPWPTPRQLKRLAVTSLGVIIAFPVFSAWAMKTIPASHGAVVNGLQPFFVAIYAYWLGGERPSRGFWVCALAGSALVIAFALRAGGGSLHAADGLMLLAVVTFGVVAVAQSLFPLWAYHPAAAGLRVHLANGLYVNALFDRLLGGWTLPRTTSATPTSVKE